ncbi:lysophospholipid acyltransferase family protein [Ornithinicoccus halotolerans]|uniref:lysophospholipid acyltransferase family protein n=1 Tax=Ornithinicoccus halotolerans TaxID=1748220 RepID=UPI0012976B5A|nr:lysophospholipid acyltransferase family protein [Ornithinicoccus halotolerans]
MTQPGQPPTDLERAVTALVQALRAGGAAAGLAGAELEDAVAGTLAFLRRRLTADFTVDEFGFDPDFTEHVYLPLLRPLFHQWFRTEVTGIEHVPAEGGALVVANHAGAVAVDSLMTQVAVRETHPQRRYLRMLAADLVFATPGVGPVARRTGSTLATHTDAERLLSSGELVGVWPEGFKGVGKPFRDRYRLQRFGRGGFVAAALRTGVPIVPCAVVGAEEAYPVLGNASALARVLGLPYLPLTPTFPWLGPLGLVPLPAKWLIQFCEPIDTTGYGPAAAEDPEVVFELTDRVRETIQHTLYALLDRRGRVFG